MNQRSLTKTGNHEFITVRLFCSRYASAAGRLKVYFT